MLFRVVVLSNSTSARLQCAAHAERRQAGLPEVPAPLRLRQLRKLLHNVLNRGHVESVPLGGRFARNGLRNLLQRNGSVPPVESVPLGGGSALTGLQRNGLPRKFFSVLPGRVSALIRRSVLLEGIVPREKAGDRLEGVLLGALLGPTVPRGKAGDRGTAVWLAALLALWQGACTLGGTRRYCRLACLVEDSASVLRKRNLEEREERDRNSSVQTRAQIRKKAANFTVHTILVGRTTSGLAVRNERPARTTNVDYATCCDTDMNGLRKDKNATLDQRLILSAY